MYLELAWPMVPTSTSNSASDRQIRGYAKKAHGVHAPFFFLVVDLATHFS
jgi:hypothetical protein